MEVSVANTSAKPGSQCVLGIGEICTRTPAKLEDEAFLAMMFCAGTAMIAFAFGSIIHVKNISWVPESLVVVCVGMVLGYVLYEGPLLGERHTLDEELTGLIFGYLLKLVALPIIVFESGWSLRLRDFVSQLGYILLFAVFGTILSVIVVTLLILQTSHLHGISQPRTALAYASLISSVDPVATLATFGHLNVDPLLFILVFGESQINDAVAITLFNAVNKRNIDNWGAIAGEMAALLFGAIAGEMAALLFGSIGLGVVLAMAFLLVLRFGRMGESCSQAITFIFVSCFFTFSFAEALGMSGIITVLFNAIVMGTFAPAHLSTECATMASFLLKQMASLADTSIFVCCGIVVVFVFADHGRGVTFGLYAAAFCLAGRFVAIVPLGLLSNGVKALVSRRLPAERRHYLSWQHLVMMWHSGLRGGVSLVLALELDPWVDEVEGPGGRHALINGTFVIVVLYLVVFGGTTGPSLRALGLPVGDEVPADATLYMPSDKHGLVWRGLQRLRRKVLLPILVGNCQPQANQHILEQVLNDADRYSHEASVLDFPRRHKSAPSSAAALRQTQAARLRPDVYDLFGTMDPAHLDALEDVRAAMRSSTSALGDSSDSSECL